MDVLLPKKMSENEILLESLNDNYVILARTIDMCYVLKRILKNEEYLYIWEEPQGHNAFPGVYYKSIQQAILDCHINRKEAVFTAFLNRK